MPPPPQKSIAAPETLERPAGGHFYQGATSTRIIYTRASTYRRMPRRVHRRVEQGPRCALKHGLPPWGRPSEVMRCGSSGSGGTPNGKRNKKTVVGRVDGPLASPGRIPSCLRGTVSGGRALRRTIPTHSQPRTPTCTLTRHYFLTARRRIRRE